MPYIYFWGLIYIHIIPAKTRGQFHFFQYSFPISGNLIMLDFKRTCAPPPIHTLFRFLHLLTELPNKQSLLFKKSFEFYINRAILLNYSMFSNVLIRINLKIKEELHAKITRPCNVLIIHQSIYLLTYIYLSMYIYLSINIYLFIYLSIY